MSRFISVVELARRYSLSKSWINREIAAGRLPVALYMGKPMKPRRIDVVEVERLFTSGNHSGSDERSLKTEQNTNHKPKPVKGKDLWE